VLASARVKLADYYLLDPRCVLVPPEHLTPSGMSQALAALLAERRGWSAARSGLFDAAFALYWQRSNRLARRTRWWPAPRRRHVVVVGDILSVRPYVQLLNTNAWMLYDADLDPERSHAELAAYLLALGDRMAVSGEVATAAVHAAAWWLERTDAECAAFVDAAARSTRPDSAGLQAVAAALPWLRRLRHETLKPLVVATPHRPIPETGLLVPREFEAGPPALVTRWRTAAEDTLARYRSACRSSATAEAGALCEWLTTDAPPLLVTSTGGRIVWDPETPRRIGGLRAELKGADGAAVRRIAADLRLITRHTRAFLGAVVDADALPGATVTTEQRGYTYLYGPRRLIAYNLREAGMERLLGPPLPYEHAMLGARTVHEWAHLADAAGWVPRVVPDERLTELEAALTAEMDAAIGRAPETIRAHSAADLRELSAAGSPGRGLVRVLLTRMPDYRANLIARRFMTEAERETYVRHNIRTLGPSYPRDRLWRMLIRYLYEFQYLGSHLGLTAITDPRGYFVDGTGFGRDFFETRVLDEAAFARMSEGVARICACWAVEESRFRGVPTNRT
jgi:hypothetical protein